MKRLIILTFLSIFFISQVKSQEYYELEEMFLDADSWFFFEDYREALPIFLRVLEADSLNYNVMYKIGFCYLNIPGQKKKAIPYLENAIKKTTFNYRKNIYTEKQAPVDALFYLGNAYLINNQIDEAIDAYTGFQNKITRTKKVANRDIYDKEYLQRQFDACRNAIQYQYEPVSFLAQNVGDKINSRFNEFNAVISGDGSTLAFTASLQFYDAIFYSKKDSLGNWNYPINIMGQLGVDDNSATTGLSFDGTELYIYRDDNFDGNIYVSYFENGLWSKVRKLGENINTKYWESHASVSPDNNKLYFVSNRENGYGDLDIYVSERETDTTWSKATNLGDVINTQWNENTPFVTPDGKRLFFSSEGHQGMGFYDIYYSEKDSSGVWGDPVNLGYPINTTNNDLFFVPFKNGSFAYSSQFSQQGYGGQDIYHYQLFNIPEYDHILVEGVLKMDNEEDRNREDFNILIVDQLNQDTLAVLNPEEEENRYQYRTPLGKNHLVYESSLNDTEGQFFISTGYDIKEVFSDVKPDTEKIAMQDTTPEIIIDTNLIKTDQENIRIKLSLQKGNKLVVNTFYKDQLINSEEFDIKKDDFIYEYQPLVGESKIRFRLIDKNNNIKTEEVTVSYLPKDTKAELSIAEKIVSLGSNGEKVIRIKLSVERGSKLFVETFVDDQLISTDKFNVKKENFVYEFEPKSDKSKLNFRLVDKYNNVTNEEIIVSHKAIDQELAEVINSVSNFNSKGLRNVTSDDKVRTSATAADLIQNIYAKAEALGLSKEQTQALIIALAINLGESSEKFITSLHQISSGDIHMVLDSIKDNHISYDDNLAVIQHLEEKSHSKNYNHIDIIVLLENYIRQSNIPVQSLLASLEELLDTDIENLLTKMGSSAMDIVTLNDLKKQLVESGLYSDQELEQIFALLEGLMIASKASGEQDTKDIKDTPAQKDTKEKDNNWLIILAALSGLILGVIIIYFNRRRNKRDRNNES